MSFRFFITESPVVVDEGSFGLLDDVVVVELPFIACVLILDFGESSAIITSVENILWHFKL